MQKGKVLYNYKNLYPPINNITNNTLINVDVNRE